MLTKLSKNMNQALLKSFSTVTVKLGKSRVCMLDESILPKESTQTKEKLIQIYKDMNLCRRMELECDALYKSKEIRGFCHLYDGQESVALGIEHVVDTKKDPMNTTYRCHPQAYTRGWDFPSIMGEITGKEGGAHRGHAGSMHYYRPENNFYGGHGIVGQSIPIGIGNGFALNYNGNPGKNISIVMYGDGAANQGQWFESANMAKLWNLPVFLVCENNRYAFGTPIEAVSANKDFYNRGAGLLIPGFDIDGHDIFQVMESTKFAKDYILKNGPIIMEAHTYRYHGHSMADPGEAYRSRDEVTQTRKTKDPIMKLQKVLLDSKLATKEELKKIEKEAKATLQAAVKEAKKMPFPSLDEIRKFVYINQEKIDIRACDPAQSNWTKESASVNGKI